MDEYIKRDAVHDLVRSLTKYAWTSPNNTGHRVTVDADDVNFGVDKIPAADVAPVRHGRWIFGKDLPFIWGKMPKNKYHLYCSECLEQAFNRSEDNDPDFDVDTPYCPNCGAKMDGGAD